MSSAWIGVLGVLIGAAVGAAAAMWGSWMATRHQDHRAAVDDLRSRREEWFRRVQWAEELANDPDERRWSGGTRILRELVGSDLATPDDVSIVEALVAPQMIQHIGTHQQEDLAIDEFVRDNGEQHDQGGP